MWKIIFAVALLGAIISACLLAMHAMLRRQRVTQRWYAATERSAAAGDAPGSARWESAGWVGRWLYLAGIRESWSVPAFLGVTATAIVIATVLSVGFWASGLHQLMQESVVLVPGGVGETFLPIVWVSPWLTGLIVALLPWLYVRSRRRQRVEQIEQDLPLALELLSTLSEAGLGFDAGLSRILQTRLAGRPLAEEFQMFQADLLSGRPRVQSLRRLSARIQVSSVSVFVSAMVQAEQLGMGIARVLRHQAEDVRNRRRERALSFANSLPVKRVIPLVVCFLPGLFVWTLGPAFVQLFKMADSFIQIRSF